jgi:hypothetical protein
MDGRWTYFANNVDPRLILGVLLYTPHAAGVHHAEFDGTAGRAGVQEQYPTLDFLLRSSGLSLCGRTRALLFGLGGFRRFIKRQIFDFGFRSLIRRVLPGTLLGFCGLRCPRGGDRSSAALGGLECVPRGCGGGWSRLDNGSRRGWRRRCRERVERVAGGVGGKFGGQLGGSASLGFEQRQSRGVVGRDFLGPTQPVIVSMRS